MAKFVNSSDSISSSLLLWNDVPTQTSIEETYHLKVWPVTNLLNDGPIQFIIPPQPKGLLNDIHIVTKLKVQQNGVDIATPKKNVSIINNLANSLWGEVSVICADRTELCQSMKNAYAYQTFFNHALNSETDRRDYLLYNEAFLMDSGVSKRSEEELRVFWKWDETKDFLIKIGDVPEGSSEKAEQAAAKETLWSLKFNDNFNYLHAKGQTDDLEEDEKNIGIDNYIAHTDAWIPTTANPAASIRSLSINNGQSLILNSKFQSPLFNTSKCLPTNMKIRISLSKNRDEFLLLCDDDAGYSIVLEDCYLNVTYYRVRDEILNLMEERLANDAAPYFISRPEIIVRPITHTSRIIRMNDIFSDKLPPYAFFALQRSVDFEGKYSSNCYSFVPYKRFQFYLNGVPYFNDSLEVTTINKLKDGDYVYKDFGEYMRQLYRTIGKDSKGSCLIDSTNFHLNFMVGISFGADRSSLSERHLNLQENASTYLEIDMGIDEVPDDLILIVYALYDRQIQIDANRMVKIIE
jgi:hypothetical protein